MVEHVVQAGHEGQTGDDGLVQRQTHEADANAEKDDADVLDGVVGKELLDVVLTQGVGHAQHAGQGADHEDEQAPPQLHAGGGEQVQADLHDTEDADLDHAAGHERRHVGRRRRVSLGKPGVEREHAGLAAEAHEGEHEAHRTQDRAEVMGAEGRKLEGAGLGGHDEEADHDAHEADVGHD